MDYFCEILKCWKQCVIFLTEIIYFVRGLQLQKTTCYPFGLQEISTQHLQKLAIAHLLFLLKVKYWKNKL